MPQEKTLEDSLDQRPDEFDEESGRVPAGKEDAGIPEIFRTEVKTERVREITRYLTNNARPVAVSVNQQSDVKWTDEFGRSHRLQIVMYREGDDNKQAKKMGISESEKLLIYYTGQGRYVSQKKMHAGYTFRIEHYPHIINFPIGTNKFDERLYTILVGDTVEVNSQEDFDVLWKAFKFLDETDKDGKIITENFYSKKLKSPDRKPQGDPKFKEMGEVEDEQLPTQMKRSTRQTELIRSTEKDEEEGV